MHHEIQKEAPRRAAAAKPLSEADRQLNEMIAREARMDRCFRCYHVECTCPPGKGLNVSREELTATMAKPAAAVTTSRPRRRTHAPR